MDNAKENVVVTPKDPLKGKIIEGVVRRTNIDIDEVIFDFNHHLGLIKPPFDKGELAESYRNIKLNIFQQLSKESTELPAVLLTSAVAK